MNSRTLPVILLLSLAFSPPASGAPEEVRLKGRDLPNCSLRVSPGLLDKAVGIESSLSAGLDRLRDLFDRPPLSGKPQFWLLSDKKELEVVLGHFFRLDANKRAAAVKLGTYRDSENIVLVVDPRTADDWLLRLLYTEHARTLLDATAPSARGLRIGWFYSGSAAYFAWLAAGEQSGHSQERTHRLIFEYYARFFNPDEFLPLQLLEVPADWEGALERKGAPVYAQAVLSVLFLVQKKSPRTPVTILRSYEREEAFSTAFSRGAEMTLKDFEKTLVSELFPEVRKMRGQKEPEAPKKEEPKGESKEEPKGGPTPPAKSEP